MNFAKVTVCILLSLSLLVIGFGYAQMSDEIFATGNLDYTYTELYICDFTADNGVSVTGYSETLISLTAEAGKSVTVTIANPKSVPYYFLRVAADRTTFSIPSDQIAVGRAIAAANGAGSELSFQVTFNETGSYSLQFVFTEAPPAINDGFMSSTNATEVVNFVIDNMTYGLNADVDKHAFAYWCTSSNRILFCLESSVSGTNLGNEFAAMGAADVYYTLEWVSSTQYHLYLYHAQAANGNRGKYIVTYKQDINYNSIIGEWVAGDSAKGYAKAVAFKKQQNQIEIGEDENGVDHVVWYATADDLPAGAIIANSTQ